MAEILRFFDSYNARATSQSSRDYIPNTNFSNAKGKVEFCIGGHVHIDHDFLSDGGIPIILTTADASQERVPDRTEDYGDPNTIYEAAVYGIIADYNLDNNNHKKITVVGVGRGNSREITYQGGEK